MFRVDVFHLSEDQIEKAAKEEQNEEDKIKMIRGIAYFVLIETNEHM